MSSNQIDDVFSRLQRDFGFTEANETILPQARRIQEEVKVTLREITEQCRQLNVIKNTLESFRRTNEDNACLTTALATALATTTCALKALGSSINNLHAQASDLELFLRSEKLPVAVDPLGAWFPLAPLPLWTLSHYTPPTGRVVGFVHGLEGGSTPVIIVEIAS